MDDSFEFSPTTLIATAAQQLSQNGYFVVREPVHPGLPADRALVAEDPYSVVAVVGFESWSQLEAEWPDAQAALVELLSRRLTRADPKAWDGYLVLLCPALPPSGEAVAEIERDTSRLRKLLAVGSDLKTTSDVLRALAPLLPIKAEEHNDQFTDPLALLPDLLKDKVPIAATQAVVDAFRVMEPPLESLHRQMNPR